MPDQKKHSIQFSFRYDSERGDKLIGYAYGTRRKVSDVLMEALDEYFENPCNVIKRLNVWYDKDTRQHHRTPKLMSSMSPLSLVCSYVRRDDNPGSWCPVVVH